MAAQRQEGASARGAGGADSTGSVPNPGTQAHLGVVLALYLLGLLVGGLYVGMVSPVRQVGTSLAPAVLVSLIASAPGMLGYQRMLICVACFCLAALVAIAHYRSPKREGKRG